ncbi:hypothetical protein AMJ39_00185 [candidate division TA06 bacterium DG_24]|jgi:outer membrane protein|uniref:OmpH family outer membrane protein n=3 Tax=Bacteria division TA06 TaxID=1156500 RepID=A0A0S8JQM5_UNCT6|nr:MAG: hypothetical protein AMJ39_00185 [candidate division TA06 bacterium DG_24]KPK69859.1 MAG: hypothetical protein AMJ82_04655 [candidate division TA06 bacterium SM23_40]KPL10971.1 MAG: hypothetical protein AMJ71_01205 [candidate division TA06 bacterium SM1_40]
MDGSIDTARQWGTLMKTLVTASAIVALASALGGEEVKIGYIDSGRIFTEYRGTADIETQLNEELRSWQGEERTRLGEIEQLEAQLESQRLMLSDESQRTKQTEIDRKRREYQEYVQGVWGPGGLLEQRNIELTQPIIERINVAIEKIASAEHYTMVLDIADGFVVYAVPGLDVTDKVIEELNREFEPLLAAGEKLKLAVFDVHEADKMARELGYGEQITQFLEAALVATNLFELVRGDDFQRAMTENMVVRTDEQIELSVALDVGRDARAEVILLSEVSVTPSEIEIESVLYDVMTGRELAQGRGTAANEEELESAVSVLTGSILEKVRL